MITWVRKEGSLVGRVGKMVLFSIDYNDYRSKCSKEEDRYYLASLLPYVLSSSHAIAKVYADSEEDLKQRAETLLSAWLKKTDLGKTHSKGKSA